MALGHTTPKCPKGRALLSVELRLSDGTNSILSVVVLGESILLLLIDGAQILSDVRAVGSLERISTNDKILVNIVWYLILLSL